MSNILQVQEAMTDVQSEGGENCSENGTEELPLINSKSPGKLNGSVIEKSLVKCTKKHKPQMKRRNKLVQPRESAVLSDFVSSSNELTRPIGLFSNGKTSTKVSGFEYVASAETKARAEQDLQKLLNLASSSHVVTTESNITEIHHDANDISQRSRMHSCQCKSFDHEDKNQANQSASPLNCDVTATYQNSRKVLTSSDENMQVGTSSETRGLHVQKNPNYGFEPPIEMQNAIALLNRTINEKREKLFPNVSLKREYRNELAALKIHCSLLRAEHKATESQSSSACNSNSLQPTAETKARAEQDLQKLLNSQKNFICLKTSPLKESNTCSKPQRSDPSDYYSAVSFSSFKQNFNPEPVLYSSPIKNALFSDVITENEDFKTQEPQLQVKEDLDYCGSLFNYPPVSPFHMTSDNCISPACASLQGSADGQLPWNLPFSPITVPAWSLPFSPIRSPEENPPPLWN